MGWWSATAVASPAGPGRPPSTRGGRTIRPAGPAAPVTVEAVGQAIDRWSVADAQAVSERVRADGGVPAHAEAFVAIYREAIAEHGAWRVDDDAWRRAVAGYVQAWSPASGAPAGWLHERAQLLAELDARLATLPACLPGTTYALDDPSVRLFLHLGRGFSCPEPGGRWTTAAAAWLALRVPRAGDLAIHLDVAPFVTPTHPRQRLAIRMDGEVLGSWTLGDHAATGAECSAGAVVIAIAAHRVPAHGVVQLELLTPDAVAPAAVGFNPDPRTLGVRLVALRVESAPADGGA